MAGQMMAVREKMGLTVRELLLAEEMKDIKVLAGDRGLDKEIKGVTIIEAPDIVKFIDGGEVLLTGLYAFRSCTVDEFRTYINELSRKSVSALVLKRGRKVSERIIFPKFIPHNQCSASIFAKHGIIQSIHRTGLLPHQ